MGIFEQFCFCTASWISSCQDYDLCSPDSSLFRTNCITETHLVCTKDYVFWKISKHNKVLFWKTKIYDAINFSNSKNSENITNCRIWICLRFSNWKGLLGVRLVLNFVKYLFRKMIWSEQLIKSFTGTLWRCCSSVKNWLFCTPNSWGAK